MVERAAAPVGEGEEEEGEAREDGGELELRDAEDESAVLDLEVLGRELVLAVIVETEVSANC